MKMTLEENSDPKELRLHSHISLHFQGPFVSLVPTSTQGK